MCSGLCFDQLASSGADLNCNFNLHLISGSSSTAANHFSTMTTNR